MRQIFSIRFVAAVGAVIGLLALLAVTVGDDDPAGVEPAVTAPTTREIDLVDWIYDSTEPDFDVRHGRATTDTQLVIDASRRLTIMRGTPGEHHCPDWGEIVGCAFAADLLGEAVVWFAIVPMGANRTVPMPAIDTLDDDVATLVNGWRVRYAPTLDRQCADDDFGSYRELRETLGDDFTSVFSIDEQRLVAVQCRRRVAYALGTIAASARHSAAAPTIESPRVG